MSLSERMLNLVAGALLIATGLYALSNWFDFTGFSLCMAGTVCVCNGTLS